MTPKASRPDPIPELRCETCRFLQAGRQGWYECHRRGPQMSIKKECDDEGINPVAVWPDVMTSDWCGEYEPRVGGRKW